MPKYLMIVTLALIVTGTSTLSAGEPRLAPAAEPAPRPIAQPTRVAQAPTLQQAPVAPQSKPVQTQRTMPVQQRQNYNYNYRTPRSNSREGFFTRMMELERRKNAWLRRTFLD